MNTLQYYHNKSIDELRTELWKVHRDFEGVPYPKEIRRKINELVCAIKAKERNDEGTA